MEKITARHMMDAAVETGQLSISLLDTMTTLEQAGVMRVHS